jgi:hypothetical protein
MAAIPRIRPAINLAPWQSPAGAGCVAEGGLGLAGRRSATDGTAGKRLFDHLVGAAERGRRAYRGRAFRVGNIIRLSPQMALYGDPASAPPSRHGRTHQCRPCESRDATSGRLRPSSTGYAAAADRGGTVYGSLLSQGRLVGRRPNMTNVHAPVPSRKQAFAENASVVPSFADSPALGWRYDTRR